MPPPARIMYYNSFILPYLTFNIIHWGNTNQTHLNPLITAQKRIIRTISDADYLDSTTPLFHRLKLLKFEDLYKFHAIMDTHKKVMSGQYSVLHTRNTRNRRLALPKFHRLSRTQQSISFNGPELWNNMPAHLRDISSLPVLKIKLKEHLLSLYAPTWFWKAVKFGSNNIGYKCIKSFLISYFSFWFNAFFMRAVIISNDLPNSTRSEKS